MKKTRILGLLLCLAMLLTAAMPAMAEEVDPRFAPYEEPITITVGRAVTSNIKFDTSNPDRESIENNLWIRTYKEELNIDVEYLFTTPTEEDADAKWYTAIASGDIPDFGYVSEAVYLSLLEAGYVADMTDIWEEYASDWIKWLMDRGGHIAEQFITFDGRMYGLPVTAVSPADTNVMIIRKDWLDKVGKEVPTTMEELIDVCYAFQEAQLGGEGTTVGLPGAEEFGYGYGNLTSFFNGYNSYLGIWVDDGSGNLVYGTVQDTTKDALLQLQKMYADGVINQDFAVTTQDAAMAISGSGRCGVMFVGFAPTAGMGPALELDENCEWIVAPVPGVDGLATMQSSAMPSKYFFVSAECEHPEAIVKMQNVECKYLVNDYYGYSTTKEGWEYFQYVAAGSSQSVPSQNRLRQEEATKAYLTGELDFTFPLSEVSYNRILEGENDRLNTHKYLWGPNSTFQVINDTFADGRVVMDAYQTQLTETMRLKKEMLDTTLTAAMQKVIMGDDISVFEKAVEDWYAQGGQDMTDEANEWYKASAK